MSTPLEYPTINNRQLKPRSHNFTIIAFLKPLLAFSILTSPQLLHSTGWVLSFFLSLACLAVSMSASWFLHATEDYLVYERLRIQRYTFCTITRETLGQGYYFFVCIFSIGYNILMLGFYFHSIADMNEACFSAVKTHRNLFILLTVFVAFGVSLARTSQVRNAISLVGLISFVFAMLVILLYGVAVASRATSTDNKTNTKTDDTVTSLKSFTFNPGPVIKSFSSYVVLFSLTSVYNDMSQDYDGPKDGVWTALVAASVGGFLANYCYSVLVAYLYNSRFSLMPSATVLDLIEFPFLRKACCLFVTVDFLCNLAIVKRTPLEVIRKVFAIIEKLFKKLLAHFRARTHSQEGEQYRGRKSTEESKLGLIVEQAEHSARRKKIELKRKSRRASVDAEMLVKERKYELAVIKAAFLAMGAFISIGIENIKNILKVVGGAFNPIMTLLIPLKLFLKVNEERGEDNSSSRVKGIFFAYVGSGVVLFFSLFLKN